MKYFVFKEIIYSVFLFFFCGAFCGLSYRAYKIGIFGFKYLCESFKKSFLPIRELIKTFDIRKADSFEGNPDKSKNEILDFVFFTICGILYITLTYIALDGIFRLYALVLYAASFLLIYKVSRFTDNCLKRIIYYIINLFALLMNLIFLPSKIIYKLLKTIGKVLRKNGYKLYLNIEKRLKTALTVIKYRKKYKKIEKK